MMRPVMLTLQDGTVMDAWLLTPAESGEGESRAIVVPVDRGSGVLPPMAANPGVDADSFVEA